MKEDNTLLGALLLTETKPQEIKTGLWSKQVTVDMLANTQDFRHNFKTSSLVCPFCAGFLEATPLENPLESKKKPWEIGTENLVHEDSLKICPLLGPTGLRKKPMGRLIEKIILCHSITTAAAAGLPKELNQGESHPLHEDPSIPKLQTFRDTEEREDLENKIAEAKASEEANSIEAQTLGLEDTLEPQKASKRDKVSLLEGNLQRVFPHILPEQGGQSWDENLKEYPRWSKDHPTNPLAPKVSGWVVYNTKEGSKVACGYLLGGTEEEGIEIPEDFPTPIFRIVGPETVLDPTNNSPVPFLEVEVVSSPLNEAFNWEMASTVQQLKKREKTKKKQKIKDELAKLPKEKIWEGFSKPVVEGIEPNLDREGEPPQTLKGYRPGGDIKKWWLPGIGNPYAKVWVIGLYPSNEEIKRKGGPKILSGPSGEELFALVKAAGLDIKNDVFFENIVKRFMPPKSKISAEVKAEQCWLLARQLAHYKPERVICLGADVYRELVGGKSFQELRGTWTDATYPRSAKEEDSTITWTGRVAGSFHPAGVLRPEGRHNLELFRHDVVELLLDRKQEDINPTIGEYKDISSALEWVEREIKELDNKSDDCIYALDTESYSLDAEDDELVSLQVSKLIGSFDQKSKRLVVKDVPAHCDVFVFQENPEPEIYEKDVFNIEEEKDLKKENQLDLFGESNLSSPDKKKKGKAKPDNAQPDTTAADESEELKVIKIKPPVITVANSASEKEEILKLHSEKRKDRDLVLFTPYDKLVRIKGHEKALGEAFNKLSKHPRCKGFVITNANHDRIRLEKMMGWDLTLPKEHGGLAYPLDTMLLEHILDENGDLGLKACLNKHFNWPRQDIALDQYASKYSLDKLKSKITVPSRQSVWSLYPWSILKPYAAKDAYGTAALLAKQLEDMDLQMLKYQKDRVLEENSNTMEAAFHISCGAINGTYEMHKMGMPVGNKGREVLESLTSFYSKHEEEMVKQYQDAVYQLTGLRDANPSSPEELSFVLFNENSPLRKQGIEPWKESGRSARLWSEIPKEERGHATPSTDAESLEIIASNCQDPELQKFLLRLSETKTILTIRSSFLPNLDSSKGIVGRINKKTWCMHTTYTPTLDTNRCRSIPNLSTFPKEEVDLVTKILGERPPHKIREIIQAPEGAWLLNRDWTTAEVLGVGYLSQDANMLEIISRMNKGMDFHCKLAIKTYKKIQETFELVQKHKTPPRDWLNANFQELERAGIIEFWKKSWEEGKAPLYTEEEIHRISKKLFKQERSNIKPVTFGVPYGREAPAIMKALNREYYVNDTKDSNGELIKISQAEAQAMIDSYKTEFPSAWGYLVQQAEFAKENGYLRDHWGYVRHFPKGMKEGDLTRKAYNYQIQHIVAVLMNQAMNDWTQIRQKRGLKSYAYATLYDNIGWVVYEDELQEVWDLSMEVMTTNRPVGPKNGQLPILNSWKIPTEGDLSKAWDGPSTKPEALGIEPHPEMNLTGLE
jgi:uracil-DNA glycosylase family 4